MQHFMQHFRVLKLIIGYSVSELFFLMIVFDGIQSTLRERKWADSLQVYIDYSI